MTSNAMRAVLPAIAFSNSIHGGDAPEDELDFLKIICLRNEIYMGKHPRFKPPSIRSLPLRKESPPSATVQIKQPATQIQQSATAKSQIDDVLLAKSDILIKAETSLKRQRIEQDIKHQLEQRKLDNRVGVDVRNGHAVTDENEVDLDAAMNVAGVHLKLLDRPEDSTSINKLKPFYGSNEELRESDENDVNTRQSTVVESSRVEGSRQHPIVLENDRATTLSPVPCLDQDRQSDIEMLRRLQRTPHPAEIKTFMLDTTTSPQPRYSATSQVRSPAAPQPVRPANVARVESQDRIFELDNENYTDARETSPLFRNPKVFLHRNLSTSAGPYAKQQEQSLSPVPASDYDMRAPSPAKFMSGATGEGKEYRIRPALSLERSIQDHHYHNERIPRRHHHDSYMYREDARAYPHPHDESRRADYRQTSPAPYYPPRRAYNGYRSDHSPSRTGLQPSMRRSASPRATYDRRDRPISPDRRMTPEGMVPIRTATPPTGRPNHMEPETRYGERWRGEESVRPSRYHDKEKQRYIVSPSPYYSPIMIPSSSSGGPERERDHADMERGRTSPDRRMTPERMMPTRTVTPLTGRPNHMEPETRYGERWRSEEPVGPAWYYDEERQGSPTAYYSPIIIPSSSPAGPEKERDHVDMERGRTFSPDTERRSMRVKQRRERSLSRFSPLPHSVPRTFTASSRSAQAATQDALYDAGSQSRYRERPMGREDEEERHEHNGRENTARERTLSIERNPPSVGSPTLEDRNDPPWLLGNEHADVVLQRIAEPVGMVPPCPPALAGPVPTDNCTWICVGIDPSSGSRVFAPYGYHFEWQRYYATLQYGTILTPGSYGSYGAPSIAPPDAREYLMRPEINYYSRVDARGYAGRESVLPEARDLGGRASVRPSEGGFVPLRQPSVRPEVYAYRTPSAQAGYERGGLNVAPSMPPASVGHYAHGYSERGYPRY